jgi:hypothetical protein
MAQKARVQKPRPDARDAVHNVQAPNHGLKKRAIKKAATRAVFFCSSPRRPKKSAQLYQDAAPGVHRTGTVNPAGRF